MRKGSFWISATGPIFPFADLFISILLENSLFSHRIINTELANLFFSILLENSLFSHRKIDSEL